MHERTESFLPSSKSLRQSHFTPQESRNNATVSTNPSKLSA